MRTLRDRGLAIVYVSHRFDEIFAIADRVTVLRDGAPRRDDDDRRDLDRERLIRAMVGRDLAEEYPAATAATGPPVLEVERLSAAPRFHDVSFTVRAGEIVGLAGLVGAGRTSLGLAIVGRRAFDRRRSASPARRLLRGRRRTRSIAASPTSPKIAKAAACFRCSRRRRTSR